MSDPWRETEHIVRRMRESLDRAEPSRGGRDAEPLVGVGEAQRGLVSVEVTGGRVSAVRIDPRAMRQPSGDLADAIAEAANAAFDDLRAALTTEVPAAPSLDELSRTLTEISAESARAMDRAAAGAQRSMDAIQRISALHRGRR